jgi:hypothetical protein
VLSEQQRKVRIIQRMNEPPLCLCPQLWRAGNAQWIQSIVPLILSFQYARNTSQTVQSRAVLIWKRRLGRNACSSSFCLLHLSKCNVFDIYVKPAKSEAGHTPPPTAGAKNAQTVPASCAELGTAITFIFSKIGAVIAQSV